MDLTASPAGRVYGWKPDAPDVVKARYRVAASVLAALPPTADVLDLLGPVLDQGQLGSCTAHGIAGAVMVERKAQGLPAFIPSRLAIYYGEREKEGTVNQDAGAAISDGLAYLRETGYCDESLWPYDVAKFKQRPPAAVYEASAVNRVLDSAAINNSPDEIQGAIAQRDPVVFGFIVFESFEGADVASTGMMPIPRRRERQLGGHCMLIVGYDANKDYGGPSKGMYLALNSWGLRWGLQGKVWMPMAFVHSSYCSDFQVVRSVPGVPTPSPSPAPSPAPTPSGRSRIIIDVDGKVANATVVFAG